MTYQVTLPYPALLFIITFKSSTHDAFQHLSLIHTISGTGSPSALHVKNTVPPNVTSTSRGSSVIFGFSVKIILDKIQVHIQLCKKHYYCCICHTHIKSIKSSDKTC
jgi:hypothetical protein